MSNETTPHRSNLRQLWPKHGWQHAAYVGPRNLGAKSLDEEMGKALPMICVALGWIAAPFAPWWIFAALVVLMPIEILNYLE